MVDGGRIVITFGAEERTDLRPLASEVSRTVGARVEARQAGPREGARLVGGIGMCGDQLCCTRFPSHENPITLRMAKDQDLPMNPGRVTGLCGRLRCCLAFEHPVYRSFRERAPAVGRTVETPEGRGVVRSYRVPQDALVVRLDDAERDVAGRRRRRRRGQPAAEQAQQAHGRLPLAPARHQLLLRPRLPARRLERRGEAVALAGEGVRDDRLAVRRRDARQQAAERVAEPLLVQHVGGQHEVERRRARAARRAGRARRRPSSRRADRRSGARCGRRCGRPPARRPSPARRRRPAARPPMAGRRRSRARARGARPGRRPPGAASRARAPTATGRPSRAGRCRRRPAPRRAGRRPSAARAATDRRPATSTSRATSCRAAIAGTIRLADQPAKEEL